MTNFAEELADRLLNVPYVSDCFRRVHVQLIHHLLGTPDAGDPVPVDTWAEVITWSSAFISSPNPEHSGLGLSAAICCLLTEQEPAYRRAAASILESVSNLPTLKLARGADLIGSELEEPTRAVSILNRFRQKISRSVFDEVSGDLIPVTDFQRKTWVALRRERDVAVSAPTSAGKSFILLRWLLGQVQSHRKNAVFAYLVPSRALIRQVSDSMFGLASEYQIDMSVATLPTLYTSDRSRPVVLVMTQERMERLLAVNPGVRLENLVVDEAQKLGDGARGVILQRVIDESLRRNSNCKVVAAAPHAVNAGDLLPRPGSHESIRRSAIVVDATPTVTQNLVWLTRVPRRRGLWNVELVHRGQATQITQLKLDDVSTKKKQMASIAVGLGRGSGGNIVFANGAGEAEDVALLIAGILEQDESGTIVQEVQDLRQLVRSSVHPSYPLAKTLSVGVGVHYGDMPEIVRREQERLFDEGKLRFLVCTSTLLEGVNLPCRNLFVRGPRQGKGRPMSTHAFWNLAGRAGRWGREFAGNIFCIQVHDNRDWPFGPPRKPVASRVNNAGQQVIASRTDFSSFCRAKAEGRLVHGRRERYFEQVLGELVAAHLKEGDLSSVGWLRDLDETAVAVIQQDVGTVLKSVSAPVDLISKHSGIHPALVSSLWGFFCSKVPGELDALMPMAPTMPDAVSVLSANLFLCDQYLGSEFGTRVQRWLKASVAVQWIRGWPLRRIIDNRLEWLRKNGREVRPPSEIRKIIKLINDNARFAIPKYMSCYADCFLQRCHEAGRLDLAADVTDLQDLYETGVAEPTTLALIAMGLSRTSAVELAERIPASKMSIEDVVEWLSSRDLEVYNISPVILREVERALTVARFV